MFSLNASLVIFRVLSFYLRPSNDSPCGESLVVYSSLWKYLLVISFDAEALSMIGYYSGEFAARFLLT